MTPEERRQAVKAMLADNPKLSQWAIAKAVGASQRTVSRDMEALGLVSANRFVANRPKAAGPQPVPLQVNGGMSRGDRLVARLRGEMAEQGLVPTSVEEEHLSTAKDLADRIERLQAMVARDGESVDEALNSDAAKAFALNLPAELWASHGVQHPLGDDFTGAQDSLPQQLDENTALSYAPRAPVSLLKEALLSGPPEDVIEQAAEWRDHGLRYLVVCNVSILQPSLRKSLASTAPFFRILRGLKKL